ncbi:hypothetical protein [Streptomyces sp. NBC_01314]|uniref:hypothetical protein n=1 Tax=Streptomyces sp. NBC_01314 TaxID=2903821 RepID=UPI0030894CF5|nr:hypothetical protein OG622_31165 [Streptomyces sp. NBC_01314]
MDLYTDLTEAQKKAFKENADDLAKLQPQLDKVREEALSRLERAGLGDGTDTLNCLACSACSGWTTGEDGKCGHCPHGWFSHNVK